MNGRAIRRVLWRTLDEYFGLVVALLVIIALLGGITAYAAGTDIHGTTTFEHTVTVQEPNPIYDTGTELTGGVFFASIAPEFEGEYSYTYESGQPNEVIVNTEVTVITRSVDEEYLGDEYWRTTEQIESDQTTVSAGETVDVPFVIDIDDKMDRVEQYEQVIGESPGESELVVIIESDVIDPNAANSTLTTEEETVTIALDETTYAVEDDGAGIGSFIQSQLPIIQRLFGIGILFASLVVAGGLAIGRYRGMLTSSQGYDTDDLAYERDRFDDWISEARVPEEKLTGAGVEIGSLEALVDVAIDCNSRVLEDPDRRTYFVLDGVNYYEFNPEKQGINESEVNESKTSVESIDPNEGESPINDPTGE